MVNSVKNKTIEINRLMKYLTLKMGYNKQDSNNVYAYIGSNPIGDVINIVIMIYYVYKFTFKSRNIIIKTLKDYKGKKYISLN